MPNRIKKSKSEAITEHEIEIDTWFTFAKIPLLVRTVRQCRTLHDSLCQSH